MFAIYDDITTILPFANAAEAFRIASQELMTISIITVSAKSHHMTSLENSAQILSDLHSEVKVHLDGLNFLGSAIESDDSLGSFQDL